VRSERGLTTIPHCLKWYKVVLRTRLPTLAMRYLAQQYIQHCNTQSLTVGIYRLQHSAETTYIHTGDADSWHWLTIIKDIVKLSAIARLTDYA